jgi:coenzyme F420 hydrogenase subunit beta
VGGDPRDESDVGGPPGKTWFRDLDEAVIEADRCIQCGTCVTACPSDSIGIDEIEDQPTLVSMCTGCSRCWDFCPRSGLRYERLNRLEASERETEPCTVAARAVDDTIRAEAQDGGAVTALLAELLEQDALDGALVVRDQTDVPLKGEAFLARSRDELVSGAGSSYNQTMQLGQLADALATVDIEDPAIALVGTPCVIQGAAALERYEWDGEVSAIDLTIALMCTRNFDNDRLQTLLQSHDIDPQRIDRIDVTEGTMYAYDETGTELAAEPVDSFDGAALRGCAECTDFVGAAADISAGGVGSDEGYTTLLVRTDRGQKAFASGLEALETTPLKTTSALDQVAEWNERKARETLPRTYDPTAQLSIGLREHREAYTDSDRSAQPLNRARVYQYEEWC